MPPFGDQRQPLGNDLVRRQARQVLALEVDPAALDLDQARDRAQGGGFARAVCADQGHDLPLLHPEGNALDGLDAAVAHAKIINSQHRRPPPDMRR